MPQLPYLTVRERLGPIQYGIIVARRLMMEIQNAQDAGHHFLSTDMVNSHGFREQS